MKETELVTMSLNQAELFHLVESKLPPYDLDEEHKIPDALKEYGRMEGGFADCWCWNYEKLQNIPLKTLHEIYLLLKTIDSGRP